MKRILDLIYSTKATLWFLLIFAISMAVATFVEDRYDTPTAYKYIYGAKWFEVVMLLLAVNFIGNINRYNLLSKKKFSGFVFHAAFIIMIIGAGVTRYIGYEGLMHIREGGTSSVIVSPQKVFKIIAVDKGEEVRIDFPLNLIDTASGIDFEKTISTKEDGDLVITAKNFLPNVTETIVENMEGGVDVIKLNVLDNGKEGDVFVVDKEISNVSNHTFSYNGGGAEFNIIDKQGSYFLQTMSELKTVTLPQLAEGGLLPNTETELLPNTQYSSVDGSFKFIFHGGFKKAGKKLVSGEPRPNAMSALMLDVHFKNQSYEVPLFINPNGLAEMQNAHVEGISLLLGYGEKEIKLPFSVKLNDFIVDRYPGSSSPSSYASEVTILDSRVGTPQNFRIYMNHILDHDGYRFFQSFKLSTQYYKINIEVL